MVVLIEANFCQKLGWLIIPFHLNTYKLNVERLIWTTFLAYQSLDEPRRGLENGFQPYFASLKFRIHQQLAITDWSVSTDFVSFRDCWAWIPFQLKSTTNSQKRVHSNRNPEQEQECKRAKLFACRNKTTYNQEQHETHEQEKNTHTSKHNTKQHKTTQNNTKQHKTTQNTQTRLDSQFASLCLVVFITLSLCTALLLVCLLAWSLSLWSLL